jgi:16S rRNA (guanine527-N7)-methyltransferase
MDSKFMNERAQKMWQRFIQQGVNEHQQKQFLYYLQLLQEYNRSINLTAINEPEHVIPYHFQDSLALGHCIDMQSIRAIADVGTGAGFPGIPLKIRYPELQVLLIEVNKKKIEFLEHVIVELGLSYIQLYTSDWRTFLRNTDFALDLIVSRALQLDELMRMFKPSCMYKQSTLVYWAAHDWQPAENNAVFIQRICPYVVGTRKRKLVFFSLPKS